MSTTELMPVTDYQSREEWLEARSTFIGASESAAILGCGYSGQNALTVYASKLHPEESAFEATEAMIVGSLIEPGLCRVFEHFAKIPTLSEKPFRVRRLPWNQFIGATLDAYHSDDNERVIAPIELKNVSGMLMKQWSDENVAPLKFQVQVAHQMLVTGASKAYLMGLIGGNKPVIRELHRNDKFIGVLQAKLIEFWGFVERRELPTDFIDWGADATSDALKTLHPDDNGETVLMPEDSTGWYEQLTWAKEKLKEYEAAKTEAENRIKAAIGDNTFGLMPDGTRLSYKTQSRKECVMKACSFRVLRTCK